MKKLLLLFVLVGLFSSTGCGALALRQDYSKIQDVKTGENPIYTYFKDRVLDFWDIFGFKFHVGEGLLVHGRVTKFGQAGIGMCSGTKLGFKGRELGYWHEDRAEFGVSIFYINRSKKTPLICNTYMFDAEKRAARTSSATDLDLYRNDDRHWASCGANVFVGFIGIDVDVRIKEIFDFLVGIVTLDISEDDTVSLLRAKQTEFKPESMSTEIIPR